MSFTLSRKNIVFGLYRPVKPLIRREQSMKILFAKNLKSFNGTLYQGNQEIASMTDNKQ
jgi:hypothetical protein